MSRLCRRSPLDRGSPRRNHGHAVTNPRMRACSTVVFRPRLLPWASRKSASGRNQMMCCAKAIDSEHESRLLKKDLHEFVSLLDSLPFRFVREFPDRIGLLYGQCCTRARRRPCWSWRTRSAAGSAEHTRRANRRGRRGGAARRRAGRPAGGNDRPTRDLWPLAGFAAQGPVARRDGVPHPLHVASPEDLQRGTARPTGSSGSVSAIGATSGWLRRAPRTLIAGDPPVWRVLGEELADFLAEKKMNLEFAAFYEIAGLVFIKSAARFENTFRKIRESIGRQLPGSGFESDDPRPHRVQQRRRAPVGLGVPPAPELSVNCANWYISWGIRFPGVVGLVGRAQARPCQRPPMRSSPSAPMGHRGCRSHPGDLRKARKHVERRSGRLLRRGASSLIPGRPRRSATR